MYQRAHYRASPPQLSDHGMTNDAVAAGHECYAPGVVDRHRGECVRGRLSQRVRARSCRRRTRSTPATQLLPSEGSNSAAAATSSERPRRLSGQLRRSSLGFGPHLLRVQSRHYLPRLRNAGQGKGPCGQIGKEAAWRRHAERIGFIPVGSESARSCDRSQPRLATPAGMRRARMSRAIAREEDGSGATEPNRGRRRAHMLIQ
jgi:hypothetical protein